MEKGRGLRAEIWATPIVKVRERESAANKSKKECPARMESSQKLCVLEVKRAYQEDRSDYLG